MAEGDYGWRPGERVRSVAEVYMPVVSANYGFPRMRSHQPPDLAEAWLRGDATGLDRAGAEAALRGSFGHLIDFVGTVTDAQLEEEMDLFGRQTTVRGHLMLVQTHLHEHLGQSIAYARARGMAPPWSMGDQLVRVEREGPGELLGTLVCSQAGDAPMLPAMTDPDSPKVRALLEALESEGITHVVGLPDNTSAPLFLALGSSKHIRLVTVSREGEAFALASGLWLGGAAPMVVIQNTGLLESGDALRGTALRMGVPLPCMVTGRGYAKNASAGVLPDEPLTRELLTRPDADTAAIFTEPTLNAWGVPFSRCSPGEDPVAAVTATIERARMDERPVALVLTAGLA